MNLLTCCIADSMSYQTTVQMLKQYNPTFSDKDWASAFIAGSLVLSLISIKVFLTAAPWYLMGSTLLTLLSHLVSAHNFKVIFTWVFSMAHLWMEAENNV